MFQTLTAIASGLNQHVIIFILFFYFICYVVNEESNFFLNFVV